MKRCVCLILLLAWAVCLFGCATEQPEIQDPVRFYYPRSKPTYGSTDSVIAWEVREAAGHTEDYLYLLRQYLKGPESDELSRTFSINVTVKDLQIAGDTAQVVLSDSASFFTGFRLTMACACLTATVTELTGVQTVIIRAESELLDGKPSITMDRDQLLLLDESAEAAAK